MKKLFVLVALLFYSVVLFAQGVDFQNLTYAEALEKAKMGNKLIFMDCYTSWCGPCQIMTNKVFPQKEAGDYFNERFICVKFDMEKGEGVNLAKQFNVRVYPTFLIIRSDNIVQHRLVSGSSLQEFIARVENGANVKTSLHYLDERYASGKLKKKEKQAYYVALQDADMAEKADTVYRELMALLTKKEKMKADYWTVMSASKIGSEDFNTILANIPVFEKNIGKETLDAFLFNSYLIACWSYMFNYKIEELPPMIDLKLQIETLDIGKKAELLAAYEWADITLHKDVARFVEYYEQQAEHTDLEQFIRIFAVVRQWGDSFTKVDYARLITATEKVMQSKEQLKGFLGFYVKSLREKADMGIESAKCVE